MNAWIRWIGLWKLNAYNRYEVEWLGMVNILLTFSYSLSLILNQKIVYRNSSFFWLLPLLWYFRWRIWLYQRLQLMQNCWTLDFRAHYMTIQGTKRPSLSRSLFPCPPQMRLCKAGFDLLSYSRPVWYIECYSNANLNP